MTDTIPVPPDKRMAIFWSTCLPLRATLALCAYAASKQRLRSIELVLAAYLGSWGVTMLIRFVQHFFLDEDDAAMYGNFGGTVWWNVPRLFHSLLLIAYALVAVGAAGRKRIRYAYAFAVVDVSVATVAGLVYYSRAQIMTHAETLFAVAASLVVLVAASAAGPRLVALSAPLDVAMPSA